MTISWLLVCICMLPVCYSYVFQVVCTRMCLCVTRMLPVCTHVVF